MFRNDGLIQLSQRWLQRGTERNRRVPRVRVRTRRPVKPRLEVLEDRLVLSATITDLGTLPGATISNATGINSSGQVVGESGTTGTERAFLYSNGQMTDLDTLLPANSGWVLQNALGINDSGQVAGQGFINGQLHAFLLNLNSQTTGTVISNGIVSPNALTASNSGQQVTVSATVNTDGSPATTGNVVFSLVDSNGTVVSDGPTGVAIGSNGQASDTLTVPGGTVAGSYRASQPFTRTTTRLQHRRLLEALNVTPSATAPTITSNPSSQSVAVGQTATFSASASGNPTPTPQWQMSTDGGKTWTNINLPSSTTITVPNATLAENGAEVRAVFTNSAGSATTSIATLTVTASSPSSVPPATPPAAATPPSIPDQIHQMVQDLVLMGQSLSSGDIAAFGQELQDYVSLLVSVELEIFQIVLNDFAQIMSA